MKYVLVIQLVTYVALGAFLLASSHPRLAAAQGLLCAVQALLFWEVFTT